MSEASHAKRAYGGKDAKITVRRLVEIETQPNLSRAFACHVTRSLTSCCKRHSNSSGVHEGVARSVPNHVPMPPGWIAARLLVSNLKYGTMYRTSSNPRPFRVSAQMTEPESQP